MRNASLFLTLGLIACCGLPHAASAVGAAPPAFASPAALEAPARLPRAATDEPSVYRVAQAAPAADPAAPDPSRATRSATDAIDATRIRDLEAEVARLRRDLQAATGTLEELRGHAGTGDAGSGLFQLIGGLVLLCAAVAVGWWRGRRQMVRDAVASGAHTVPRTTATTKAADLSAAPASAPTPLPTPAAAPRDSAAATEPGPASSGPVDLGTSPGRLIAPAAGERASRRGELAEEAPAANEATPAKPKRGRVKVGDPSPAARAEARALAERYRASIESQRNEAPSSTSPATLSGGASTFAATGALDTGTDPALDEWIDLEQQAEFFVVLGEDATAIQLLDDHIAASGDSPLPYLKLLEIHRRRNDRESYERTREAFNARFEALAPGWSVDGSSGRALDEYTDTLGELQAVWSDPVAAAGRLDEMLFHRSSSDGEAFDFPAYRDLLFLHAIARDLAGPRAPERRSSASRDEVVASPSEPLEIDLLLPLDEDAAVIASGPIEPVLSTDAAGGHTATEARADGAAKPRDDGALDLDVSGWGEDGGQAQVLHTHRATGADRAR
ncbi:hypothetical protein [Piscinibacter koreensis]|uniref:Uncharacterized protein n=1 Tax=Piscinibacter koreensis TaxID=2742824 RepID=A0A7Y6NS16_9BURK|nr:hypothetical protein [Schlegelella koreensis]NUZ08281.1 hypothetical protein [Schlegelella koreensis]